MLEFLKEMVEYYCWEGYSIWEFLSVIMVEILIIAWVITNVILVFKIRLTPLADLPSKADSLQELIIYVPP